MHLSVVVLAAILVACHAFVPGKIDVELPVEIDNYDTKGGMLVNFLEKFKDVLKKGDAKLGIPVLDPFLKKHMDVNVNQKKLIEMQGTLDNVRAVGLSAYTVNQGDFKLIGFMVDVDLTWDQIDLMTNYKVTKGNLIDTVSFYGEGHLAANLKGLNVKVQAKLSVNDDKKLYVKSLTLNFHLKKIDFQITGLYNDAEMSKLVSTIVSDMTPQLIEDYQKQLSKYGSPLVADVLNGFLKNMTMDQLIDMITGKS